MYFLLLIIDIFGLLNVLYDWFQEASDVVELAYNDYANASQRLSLLEEFYGPSFTLFKVIKFVASF